MSRGAKFTCGGETNAVMAVRAMGATPGSMSAAMLSAELYHTQGIKSRCSTSNPAPSGLCRLDDLVAFRGADGAGFPTDNGFDEQGFGVDRGSHDQSPLQIREVEI